MEINYCYGCMEPLEPGQHICHICGHDNSIRDNQNLALNEGSILRGKYLVGKVLGKGGFGITYLGLQLNLNIRVAIKEHFPQGFCSRYVNTKEIVLSDKQNFERSLRAFESEALTLAKFKNEPSIVRVIDYFQENNTAYIVMDYIEGPNLKEEIRRLGRIPWKRVLSLMMPLMWELDQLHQEKIIHRDIKPDNIKIMRDQKNGIERLILLDFGAARFFTSSELSGTYSTILTPGFAPYEQYLQHTHLGPYTDIYALCATMYNSITGKMPPAAPDRMLGEDKLQPFSVFGLDVPEYVERAIFHGMERNYTDRPQSMYDLYQEFAIPAQQEQKRKDGEARAANENEKKYELALTYMNIGSKEGYAEAEKLLHEISGWKDADDLLQNCRDKLDEIMSGEKNDPHGQKRTEGNTVDHSFINKVSNDNSDLRVPEANIIKKTKISNNQQLIRLLFLSLAFISMLALIFWLLPKGKDRAPSEENRSVSVSDQINNDQTRVIIAQETENVSDFQYQTENETTPEPVNMQSPVDTGMPKPTDTAVPAATSKPTETPHPTDTNTPKPTDTAVLTATSKSTETPYPTDTNTPKPTDTAVPTATSKPTETPYPTDTNTPKPTDIIVPTATAIPANTPKPIKTVDTSVLSDITQLVKLGEEAYVRKDYETAASYLLPAADEKKHPAAQFYVGYMHEKGYGVDQSYEKALEYYRLAADQGNVLALNNIGFMYENGYGVDQSYKKALEYYRLAAEQGYDMAQYSLGTMYLNGYGVRQSYEKALEYYHLAADQGNDMALNNIGFMYENGYGVDQSYEKALEYYRLAAEQGNDNAQFNLGTMYLNGYGVRQSYEKALEYYRLAADQGNIYAQYYLGLMYEFGRGVERSYEKALEFYRLAAEQGNEEAGQKVEELLQKINGSL